MSLTTLRREHLESESVLVLVRLLAERGDEAAATESREALIDRLLNGPGWDAARTADLYGSDPNEIVWPDERTYVLTYDVLEPGIEFQVHGEPGAWFNFQRYVVNPTTQTTWIDCYGGSGSGMKSYVKARAFRPDRLKRNAKGQLVVRKHRSHKENADG